MKRVLAFLLVVLMMISLVGCNNSASKPSNSPDAANSPQQDTKASTANGAEKPAEPAKTEPLKTEPPKTEPAPTEPPYVFEEVTAVDNDYCTIKITGVEVDRIWGYTLKVLLENKSPDKTFMYSVKDGSVNGVVWDPLFATTVAPGKKANEKISFSDNDKEALLQDFTDIEMTLRVYDSDDWSADPVALETVHVYPLGQDKATPYVREPQSTDTVIVDNDQISIIVTGYRTDSIWGYTADLYLVNKTDKCLMFSTDDVSVNGFMCDPLFATTVAPGKVSFSDMNWFTSSLEENGISKVEEIELTIRVYDYDNWSADNIYKETVTLNP